MDKKKIRKKVGLTPSAQYKPLKEDEVKKIADSALDILERSGIAVYSDSAFSVLKDAGADADEQSRVVKMPRGMVEDAVDSTPSSVTLFSRDGRFDAVLEKNRVHYGTGGTAIYVLDPETGERRPSTVQDVILNARMVDLLENIHVFTINVFPNEIENREDIDVNRFFHAFDNTTKHVMGGIYSMNGCKKVVKMAETIAGGPKRLRNRPFVSFITLMISPFKVDRSYGEIMCYLAKENLPVVVPTEPMCGTTSPITLAGNVLVHTAETLAGITILQNISKGSPGICGSVGSISDLRTMGNLAGSIERGMINAAVAQMAQYFEIPTYSTGGTTDAKDINIQAAYESALSSLLVAMSGANYIHDIAGLMEFDLTVSYEKLVVDNEILGMCQRVLKGIEVNDETLAKDLIIEKGPGKDFLGEEHTVRFMREEFFTPSLANRDKREVMKEKDDALARARDFVHEVMDSKPESKIERSTREILNLMFPKIQFK
jgi:trimethylamine---corrinoid protein Co-methyltransferase